jgi:hypothetical protein
VRFHFSRFLMASQITDWKGNKSNGSCRNNEHDTLSQFITNSERALKVSCVLKEFNSLQAF